MKWSKPVLFLGVLALLLPILLSQEDVYAQPPDSVGREHAKAEG